MRAVALLLVLLLQDPPDREAMERCSKAARRSIVGVEVHFRRKSRTERDERRGEPDRGGDANARLAERRWTLDTWATVIDDKGTLVLATQGLNPGDIEKISVTAADGSTCDATIEAVGCRYDFFALRTSKPAAAPLAFEEFVPFEQGQRYYTAAIDRIDARWQIAVRPATVSHAPLIVSKEWQLGDPVRPGSAIFDAKGRSVGIALDDYLWRNGSGDSFIGRNIVTDERISIADLKRRLEKLEEDASGGIERVEFLFRQDNPEDDEERDARFVCPGAAIDDRGTLLLPNAIPADMVRRIESVRVLGRDSMRPATFVGSFKAFLSMVVRADGQKTRPVFDARAKPLVMGQLYVTVKVEDKFGRSFATASLNRVFRTGKGMKGTWKPQFRRWVDGGSFIADLEGRFIGFTTYDRPDEDIEKESAEEEQAHAGPPDDPIALRRILLFADLAPHLEKPSFDLKAMPQSKKEERTPVWLGVEFQELSKPLAELLNVSSQDLTHDGKRGLLVTDIYPDSPASKAGLQLEDILLTVKADNQSIELNPADYAIQEREDIPWRSPRNYLTSLLTRIGTGREVTFEVVRSGQKRDVTIKLEEGPVNFDSAPRLKDDDLGLTVKALTYEVRYFNKLDKSVTGVILAKVESGSKASTANLELLSIVTRVNNQPVSDPAGFAQLLEAQRKAGTRSVTLTVLHFGQTRMADLELGP